MRPRDAVTAYAEQVVASDVPAGTLHRLACARHLRDLATQTRYTFDPVAAQHAIAFFPACLRHSQGEWAGQPIALAPWQQFLVGSICGWRDETGLRRFRSAFIECPRGQGKTVMSSGLALLLTFFDNEPGAAGFSVATKREQARLTFEAAARSVRQSPGLHARIDPQAHALVQDATASRFVALGADANTLDGLRPHVVIADEVHAHPSGDLIEIMQTGMGTRRQPLLFMITTAGKDRESVWWRTREFSRQVLEGVVDDDTAFALIACADPEDDWTDEATWIKANPSYGISVKPERLHTACAQAQAVPAKEADFRRLHCGQLVEADGRVIRRDQWDACGETYGWEAFHGRIVFAGLDLAKTSDLTACTWLTAEPDGRLRVWTQAWIPEAKLASHHDRVDYRLWARQGWVTVTPGNVVDYRRVRADILEKARTCNLRALGFDPWSAAETAAQLADELGDQRVIEVRQGYPSLAEPMQRLLALLASGQLIHPNSPLLSWCADNLQVETDVNGNMRPSKSRSRERIDAVSALVNALHLHGRLGTAAARAGRSVYDARPVLIL